jgi:hypothetical protein
MLPVRPVIASSANYVPAVFSPHTTLLNTLYAKAMLQQEVQAGKAMSAHPLARGVQLFDRALLPTIRWICHITALS